MKTNKPFYLLIMAVSTSFLLSACSHLHKPKTGLLASKVSNGYLADDGPPEQHIDLEAIADAIPKPEPLSRYGNPEYYSVAGENYKVLKKSKGYSEQGLASWYGKKWHGKRTSSGEPYDLAAMTAAHRTLPLPTYVRVTNLANGKKVVVKVNDRGPFRSKRIIDLSYAAAAKLGIVATGTAKVLVEALESEEKKLANTILIAKSEPPAVITPEAKIATSSAGAYLQLGSFAYHENATSFMREIESLTGRSPIIVATTGDHPFYQVKLGPVETDEEIKNLTTTITNGGHSQPILVHV